MQAELCAPLEEAYRVTPDERLELEDGYYGVPGA